VLLGLIVLLVVARLLLALTLPWIVNGQARDVGVRVEWEHLDLSLLRGELQLRNLAVSPVDGKDPFLTVGFARVDLIPLALLSKRAHVRRVEVDNLVLLIDRDERGASPFLEMVQRIRARSTSTLYTKLKFLHETTLEVIAEAVVAQHAQVHLRDASVSPRVDALLEADLRASDVTLNATLPRPARLDLTARCSPGLERLKVEGELKATERGAQGALAVALESLRLGPFAGHLALLGLEPAAGALSFGTRLELTRTPSLETPGTEAVVVRCDDTRLVADGHQVLSLRSVLAEAPVASPERIAVTRVEVSDLATDTVRTEAGFTALGLRPRPREDRGAEAPPTAQTASVPAKAGVETFTAPPVLELRDLLLRNLRARFHDEKERAALPIEVTLDHLEVRGLKQDPATPDAAATLDVLVTAPGVVDSIAVVGTAVPFSPRQQLTLALDLEGIAPRALEPYLASVGIEPLLRNGSLKLDLDATAERLPGGAYQGEAALSSITYRDGEELGGVERIRAKGTKLDLRSLECDISLVEVSNPRFALKRDASGAIVAAGFRIVPALLPRREHRAGGEKPAAREKTPRLQVDLATLHDIRGRFDDKFTKEPVHLEITDGGFEVRTITCDFSRTAPAPSPALFRGWLAAPGLVESVAVVGSVVASPFAPRLSLATRVDGITLRAVAPYLENAGARSDLERGRLELACHADAKLEPGELEASGALDRLSFRDLGGARERELLLVEDAARS
jgi:hypothetical protein